MFEGWKLRDVKKTMGFKIVYNDDFEINIDTLAADWKTEGGYISGNLQGNTIEAIANIFKYLTLTPNALKEIYGT
jgi:hypothetical protein